MGLLTVLAVKTFEFQKFKMAAILKTVKSPYLRNRMTNIDEIWHGHTLHAMQPKTAEDRTCCYSQIYTYAYRDTLLSTVSFL